MRYNLKVIATNNRDKATAVVYAVDETNYIFSCPDIFQRTAGLQKMNFKKSKYVFIPSLAPDYITGFQGFFLSSI